MLFEMGVTSELITKVDLLIVCHHPVLHDKGHKKSQFEGIIGFVLTCVL